MIFWNVLLEETLRKCSQGFRDISVGRAGRTARRPLLGPQELRAFCTW